MSDLSCELITKFRKHQLIKQHVPLYFRNRTNCASLPLPEEKFTPPEEIHSGSQFEL
jgi:predicted metalloenzyme YecM